MNEDIIRKYVKERDNINYFHVLVKENISKIHAEQQKAKNEQREIDETLEVVKSLSEHAQASSFVKLSPICYIPATIKHTGEYNVAFNPSYQCTLTQKQTLEYLNRRHSELSSVLEVYESQVEQMQERINYDHAAAAAETLEMPLVIKSENGIAFKQGSLYEIVEEDKEEVPVKGKRISRISVKQ